MADLQLKQVMVALANYMASAPLNLSRTGAAIAVWAMEADAAIAAPTWSVVRPYGGRVGQSTVPDVAVQVYTVAREGTAAAIERASALHNRLRDELGRPLREFSTGEFVIKGIRNLTLPGKIGVNDQGRPEVVFNFDMSYLAQ